MSDAAGHPLDSPGNKAQDFLATVFFLTTLISIAVFAASRLYWIAKIFGLFGLSWGNEELYSINIWKLHLSSGDPAFKVYLFAFLIAMGILYFRRGSSSRQDGKYLFCFRVLFIYSAAMIVVQFAIKIALFYLGYFENGSDSYFTWTDLTWGDAPGLGPVNAVTLLSVDDPHVVTLLASVIGVIAVAYPDNFKSIVKYIFKNVTP